MICAFRSRTFVPVHPHILWYSAAHQPVLIFSGSRFLPTAISAGHHQIKIQNYMWVRQKGGTSISKGWSRRLPGGSALSTCQIRKGRTRAAGPWGGEGLCSHCFLRMRLSLQLHLQRPIPERFLRGKGGWVSTEAASYHRDFSSFTNILLCAQGLVSTSLNKMCGFRITNNGPQAFVFSAGTLSSVSLRLSLLTGHEECISNAAGRIYARMAWGGHEAKPGHF